MNAGIDLTLCLGSVHVSSIVLFDLIFHFVPVITMAEVSITLEVAVVSTIDMHHISV